MRDLKKNHLVNISGKDFTINKEFWNSINSLFWQTKNFCKTAMLHCFEKNGIITDESKIAKNLINYYVNIVGKKAELNQMF